MVNTTLLPDISIPGTRLSAPNIHQSLESDLQVVSGFNYMLKQYAFAFINHFDTLKAQLENNVESMSQEPDELGQVITINSPKNECGGQETLTIKVNDQKQERTIRLNSSRNSFPTTYTLYLKEKANEPGSYTRTQKPDIDFTEHYNRLVKDLEENKTEDVYKRIVKNARAFIEFCKQGKWTEPITSGDQKIQVLQQSTRPSVRIYKTTDTAQNITQYQLELSAKKTAKKQVERIPVLTVVIQGLDSDPDKIFLINKRPQNQVSDQLTIIRTNQRPLSINPQDDTQIHHNDRVISVLAH